MKIKLQQKVENKMKYMLHYSVIFMLSSMFIHSQSHAFQKGEACGGIAGIVCDKGLMCEYPAGSCGIADVMGKCIERPEICTKDFRPVCGCDKRTYSNDCQRQAAGVSKAYDGKCGAKTMMKK